LWRQVYFCINGRCFRYIAATDYRVCTYARKLITTFNMLATSLLFAALAARGLAQAPAGYRTVYITSNVDAKFVVVAKARTAGSTTVVCVLALTEVTG
jgi:hypothetical protein